MKKSPFKTLRNKLDRVFSLWIRQRHADEGGTVECVTCGKLMFWKDSHCGHFVKRGHMATRWHEQNCDTQCVSCNTYQGGRQDDYAKYIIDEYGQDVFDSLMQLKYSAVKHTRDDLQRMIDEYEEKLKGLK